MKQVLVVEDDEISRKLVMAIVRSCGAFPIAVPDGKCAHELLCCTPDIGLVITDCLMPVMDGRALIKEMRADERLAQIPVIILSGFVRIDEIEELLESGASRFLPKPIDRRMLTDYIEYFLEDLPVNPNVIHELPR